jgi:O-methyltransferase involved in polyketide biosynthesis
MDDRQPSQTALAPAAARAAHLVVDREPLIFRDPVAADLIGEPGAEQVRQQDAVPAALWRRSDALRPADLCRLVRTTVSG